MIWQVNLQRAVISMATIRAALFIQNRVIRMHLIFAITPTNLWALTLSTSRKTFHQEGTLSYGCGLSTRQEICTAHALKSRSSGIKQPEIEHYRSDGGRYCVFYRNRRKLSLHVSINYSWVGQFLQVVYFCTTSFHTRNISRLCCARKPLY